MEQDERVEKATGVAGPRRSRDDGGARPESSESRNLPAAVKVSSSGRTLAAGSAAAARVTELEGVVARQRLELAAQAAANSELEALVESTDMMLGYVNHEVRNLLFGQQANLEHAMDLLRALDEAASIDDESSRDSDSCDGPEEPRPPPLASLGSVLQLLTDASSCSSVIVRIVNDTLDSKRAAQSKFLATEQKPCRLVDILDCVARNSAHKLDMKAGLRLEAESHVSLYPEDSTPAELRYYMTDADRITQVLANLVSNAIKYTDAGAITIRTRDVAGGRVTFSVIDSGDGVPEDVASQLFKGAYVQSDKSNKAEAKKGTGLGLFLCRAIVEDTLGGSIGCAKDPDRGAVFHFTVPMPRCGAPPGIDVETATLPPFCAAMTTAATHGGGGGPPVVAAERAYPPPTSPVVAASRQRRGSVVDDPSSLAAASSSFPTGGWAPPPTALLPSPSLAASSDGCVSAARRRASSSSSSMTTTTPDAASGSSWDLQQRRRGGSLSSSSGDAAAAPSLAPPPRFSSGKTSAAVRSASELLADLTIVVADDSKINRSIISRALTGAGATVVLAEDGAVALELFRSAAEGEYDLLWTDIEMPRLGGAELVAELRASRRYDDLPIVAFTGSVNAAEEAEYLHVGCTVVVKKPCRPAKIAEMAATLLGRVDCFIPPPQLSGGRPPAPSDNHSSSGSGGDGGVGGGVGGDDASSRGSGGAYSPLCSGRQVVTTSRMAAGGGLCPPVPIVSPLIQTRSIYGDRSVFFLNDGAAAIGGPPTCDGGPLADGTTMVAGAACPATTPRKPAVVSLSGSASVVVSSASSLSSATPASVQSSARPEHRPMHSTPATTANTSKTENQHHHLNYHHRHPQRSATTSSLVTPPATYRLPPIALKL